MRGNPLYSLQVVTVNLFVHIKQTLLQFGFIVLPLTAVLHQQIHLNMQILGHEFVLSITQGP